MTLREKREILRFPAAAEEARINQKIVFDTLGALDDTRIGLLLQFLDFGQFPYRAWNHWAVERLPLHRDLKTFRTCPTHRRLTPYDRQRKLSIPEGRPSQVPHWHVNSMVGIWSPGEYVVRTGISPSLSSPETLFPPSAVRLDREIHFFFFSHADGIWLLRRLDDLEFCERLFAVITLRLLQRGKFAEDV